MIVRRRAAASSIALLIFIVCTAAARSDQTYRVEGSDTYQIGGRDVRSVIGYRGTQRLTIRRIGASRQYVARAEYLRDDQGTHARVTASFESTILPSGEQRDGANEDPDYLTVLNQPFAVQLDPATMHDLAHLSGSVPFDFPSPMTGAPLHGTLRHVGGGATLNGEPVVGVAFDASGPLHGTLPDHPNLALAGHIRMNGTAFYDAGALLLALDATLSITGNVSDDDGRDPVEIVYKRSIKAIPRAMQTAVPTRAKAAGKP
jgi:hypothetical protein